MTKNAYLKLLVVMMAAALTACSSNDDNPAIPSGDVNKGIVLNLGSIVIKPYMQFGTSIADVETYAKGLYADWSYTLEKDEPYWEATYRIDNESVRFFFTDTPGGSYIMVTYGYLADISYSAVKAELERNGFSYEGRLFFDGDDVEVCYMYLSADKTIEVQYCRWDDGWWCVGFQPLDENDLNYLKHLPDS